MTVSYLLRVCALGTASLAFAPFQCAGKAKPDLKAEEEPGEALYKLSEDFKAKGDDKARVETLRFLIARYPSSRFAEAAKLDLEGK